MKEEPLPQSIAYRVPVTTKLVPAQYHQRSTYVEVCDGEHFQSLTLGFLRKHITRVRCRS